jgi:hypothetical protein
MVQSAAPTVTAYLAELSEGRRAEVKILLDLVRKSLKPGIDSPQWWHFVTVASKTN